jgi:hypothetical protein
MSATAARFARTRLVVVLVVLAAAAAPAFARELVQNGNFEQDPLANGWVFDRCGNYPDTGNCRFRWRHNLDPDRDFEVMVQKTLHRGAQLSQVVAVPSLDLEFDASCRMYCSTRSETTWTAACVNLEYLDADDSLLGTTTIYKPTSGCTWTSDSRLHLIRVSDTLWHDYHIDVADELARNLPGVSAGDIVSIRIGVLGFVVADC